MLLILAIAFGLLFIHPYVTYPLSLLVFRVRRPVLQPDAVPPSATLVFCAYNEAATMSEKIANLRLIKEIVPDIQFKAYVDLSTDDTLAILRQHGDLIDVRAAEQRTGKALGMRHLVAATTTDIIIFTDANVIVDPPSVLRLLEYFSDPQVGGVCGQLVYVNPDESATSGVNSIYWQLEERIKRWESRSGSTMGADGALFATRRAYYPEVPAHLVDDFIASMSIVFAGLRLVSAPDVFAYERGAADSGDEFRRKRRIACGAYSSHRHLVPRLARMSMLDLYKYGSHRVIRWYGAASAALSALFGLAWIGASFGWLWTLGFTILGTVAIAAVLAQRRGPGARIGELLRALVATMLGVIDAWRGKRYQTWEPAQTR